MNDPFHNLPKGHYGAILADPPWNFAAWDGKKFSGGNQVRKDGSFIHGGARGTPYETQSMTDLAKLPVGGLAAEDCVLFMWCVWPTINEAFGILDAWGFKYKTCAFLWLKADQYRLFALEEDVHMGMGYWTRANSEPCLLATRGRPKRRSAGIRQGIIEPRREHSRKPDCVHERVQQLIDGPYLELFARQQRPGWDVWGNETSKFKTENTWDEMWSRPFYDDHVAADD